MNERIEELAKQAGWTEGYYESDDGPFIEPEFNKEKFAELIVKETTNAIIKGHKGHINPALARESANKHFGVEE